MQAVTRRSWCDSPIPAVAKQRLVTDTSNQGKGAFYLEFRGRETGKQKWLIHACYWDHLTSSTSVT